MLYYYCFYYHVFYCSNESGKQHTYVFSNDGLNISQDGLLLSVSVQADKQWDDDEHHPDIPFGAQYDCVLTNDSGYVFEDWTVQIAFSDNTYIDSSWNGRFSANGNNLLVVSTEDTSVVPAYGETTFGVVMYSTEFMTVENYALTGYRVFSITDLVPFWVLISFAGIWLLVLLVHLIIYTRTKRYLKQQKVDSEIIKQSMNTFISFIDAKDSYTKGHSARVAAYSVEIAKRMKLPADEVTQLYYITLMHDCGKIGIPDAILKKPGKLTAEEYKIIQSHTILGDAILVNFTAIPEIRDGAHYHHERYDGSGYPDGLKGQEIPLCARIICVGDSYDAMSTTRCYRSKLSRDVILQELNENSGKQFDPVAASIMITMIEDGFTEKVQAEFPSFGVES